MVFCKMRMEELIKILRRLEKVEESLKADGSEYHRKRITEIRTDFGDLLMREQFNHEVEKAEPGSTLLFDETTSTVENLDEE